MIARYSSATLGLLAFFIVVTAGLFTHNPFTVTLSRSIFALFTFCFIGFVLGGAAQLVINENLRQRKTKIREKFRKISAVKDDTDLKTEAVVDNTKPVAEAGSPAEAERGAA